MDDYEFAQRMGVWRYKRERARRWKERAKVAAVVVPILGVMLAEPISRLF